DRLVVFLEVKAGHAGLEVLLRLGDAFALGRARQPARDAQHNQRRGGDVPSHPTTIHNAPLRRGADDRSPSFSSIDKSFVKCDLEAWTHGPPRSPTKPPSCPPRGG